MVRRAAQEQPQNQANTSSQRCQNPAQSTAESNVSQPTQMPLQGSVSAQIPQQSYSQPIQAQLNQPINQPINQVYYAVPNATQPTAMSSLQQQVPTSASYSSPSAVVNQAAQCTTMPMTSVQPGIAQPVMQPVMQQPVVQSVSQLQTPILLGTYAPKIDDKGRVALPAKFRAQLGGGFVMARGQERCVYVLPMVEFQRMTAQIQHTSMSNKSARDYLRVFLSGAVDEEPDKQGRIVVPPMLRDYASLGDEIVVIGVGTRAEIWNKSAWEAYLADREQGYADIADDVLPAVM